MGFMRSCIGCRGAFEREGKPCSAGRVREWRGVRCASLPLRGTVHFVRSTLKTAGSFASLSLEGRAGVGVLWDGKNSLVLVRWARSTPTLGPSPQRGGCRLQTPTEKSKVNTPPLRGGLGRGSCREPLRDPDPPSRGREGIIPSSWSKPSIMSPSEHSRWGGRPFVVTKRTPSLGPSPQGGGKGEPNSPCSGLAFDAGVTCGGSGGLRGPGIREARRPWRRGNGCVVDGTC